MANEFGRKGQRLTTNNVRIHASRLSNGRYTCIVAGIVWYSLPDFQPIGERKKKAKKVNI